MKTLYLQCNMGAAGDMLMAALYELLEPEAREQFLRDMSALGIPGVEIAATPAQKCGIWGTHMEVRIDGQEEHSQDVHGHCHGHDGEEHGHCHGEEGHEHGHCHRHGGEHTHGEGCGHHHDGEEHAHSCCGQGHSHDGETGHCHGGEESGEHNHCHGHAHSHAMQADGQSFELTAPAEQEGHCHHHGEEPGEHGHCHGGHGQGGCHAHAEGGHCHDEEGHEHGHCHAHEGEHTHGEGCGHHHGEEHVHCHNHDGEEHGHCHSHDGEEHNHCHGEGHGHCHHHGGEHGHTHAHGHSHSGMADIEHLLSHLAVSEKVRQDALAVYRLIAQAESHAHGQPISQIHFHEVGTMDAVADVVGVCMLMERIGAQKILASAVHVGSGQVRCAHGILPVPAPATAHILQGVPTYGGEIAGELCTPTGAALLRHFAQGFGPMPALRISAIGYGMGTKDFAAANCVRAFLGDDGAGEGGPNGEIALLCCNLDDMPGEDLGFAQQALLDAGALDVYTLPIGMKKSRPAVLLCCICEPSAADALAAAMLQHTSTFGVRKTLCQRYMLSRSFEQVQTPYGTVRIKTGQGYGAKKSKPEYEDLARIAREQGISLAEARALLK